MIPLVTFKVTIFSLYSCDKTNRFCRSFILLIKCEYLDIKVRRVGYQLSRHIKVLGKRKWKQKWKIRGKEKHTKMRKELSKHLGQCRLYAANI